MQHKEPNGRPLKDNLTPHLSSQSPLANRGFRFDMVPSRVLANIYSMYHPPPKKILLMVSKPDNAVASNCTHSSLNTLDLPLSE